MPAKVIGTVPQRELVKQLVSLIDDAMRPQSTAHRDIARSGLRKLLAEANWNTSYVLNNISIRRCRYLASLGYPVPSRWLIKLPKEPGREWFDD